VNWVDLTIIIVLALFGLRGFFRGFFREVFSLAGLILGFIAAGVYEPRLSAIIAEFWQVSPLVTKAAGFIAIFFAVYFLFNLIGWLLHRSDKLLFLKALNRTAGVAIGTGKGAAVAALTVFFLGSSTLLSAPVRENFATSYFAAPLSQLAEGMIRVGREKVFAPEGARRRTQFNDFRL
jgi:membrane protein required for colicin V production